MLEKSGVRYLAIVDRRNLSVDLSEVLLLLSFDFSNCCFLSLSCLRRVASRCHHRYGYSMYFTKHLGGYVSNLIRREGFIDLPLYYLKLRH